MGASSFITVATGESPQAAFQAAVAASKAAHRATSYTGSIAEKQSFIVLPTPSDLDPYEYAGRVLDADDPRVADKWGPAACLVLGGGEFLFFGWSPC